MKRKTDDDGQMIAVLSDADVSALRRARLVLDELAYIERDATSRGQKAVHAHDLVLEILDAAGGVT